MGDWKGIKQAVAKNPNAPLRLYNLKDDISETTDVAAEHPEVVEKIESILLKERDKPALKKFRFGNYHD